MPVSEQEQRLLEEMERSLYQNDAGFVATVNPRRGKPNYTVLAIGVLIAVVGVVALLGGVIIHQPIVGVLGDAYQHLARTNNTMIVTGNMTEVAALIATAMTLMKGGAKG